MLIGIVACRDKGSASSDSARQSLAPVYSLGPLGTNWNAEAGPIMIVSNENSSDTAAVVFPERSEEHTSELQSPC